jgi:hypothetical protein
MDFGRAFIRDWTKEHRAFLHILDPSQLFRMVHAAEMLSARSSHFSARDCFDAHLVERHRTSLEQPTSDFDLILRIADESVGAS